MSERLPTLGFFSRVALPPPPPAGGRALRGVRPDPALVLAFPVGLLLGLARLARVAWLRWPVTVLVHVVRSTPLLMVVFWAYFFLPVLTGHKGSQFATMLAALVLFDGVYLAEIVRAGVQGVPAGQMESALSLGLSRAAALRFVVLPQALRQALPSLINQFVSTIKATSLGTIIGLTEVSHIAGQINAQVMVRPTEVYLVLALTYFVLCFGLSQLARLIDARRPAPPHFATSTPTS